MQGVVVLSIGKVPELRPDEVFCDGWPDGCDGAVGGKGNALDPSVDIADKAHMGDSAWKSSAASAERGSTIRMPSGCRISCFIMSASL